jgi:hypothetical protein
MFPRKILYRPAVVWLLGALMNLSTGVHSSFGKFAHISARDPRLGSWTQGVNCSKRVCTSLPLQSEIRSSSKPPK